MFALSSLVRYWLAVCLAATVLGLAGAAAADEAADRAQLDRLFAQLHVAPDAASAHRIDQQIWQLWTEPSNEILRLRMLDVVEARSFMEFERALQLAKALTEDYPDYAEGWNQRATLHFLLGRFDESLADIERVLALEPRHFGALAGRVLIYLTLGDRPAALKTMVRALDIHPFLPEREYFPELQDVTRT